MKIKPKNLQIARWDYHATHINQLLTLATVEEKKAAQILRWSFYHCFQCHLNFPNFKSFLEPQQNDGAGTWPDRGRPITKLKLPAFEIGFGSNLFDEIWPQTLKQKLSFSNCLIDFHKKKEDIP